MPPRTRELIINDETAFDVVVDPTKGRGLDLSNRPRGYAYGDVAEPFPAELLIPRSEWQARIKEMEDTKTRLSDLCDSVGLKVKDQQQTSYCWVNAPTHCTEIIRAVQNEPHVGLSPASIGAQITGYRNVGGWGLDALKFIVAHGIVPDNLWPDNAINRAYATQANLDVAKKYRVQEWWEGEPRNIDQVVSCLLRRIPVSAGYNWWGHQVTLVDPVWLDGTIAIRIDNSWGTSWGTNGRGILQGNRMLPDDATMPRTAIES